MPQKIQRDTVIAEDRAFIQILALAPSPPEAWQEAPKKSRKAEAPIDKGSKRSENVQEERVKGGPGFPGR